MALTALWPSTTLPRNPSSDPWALKSLGPCPPDDTPDARLQLCPEPGLEQGQDMLADGPEHELLPSQEQGASLGSVNGWHWERRGP